MATRTSQSCDKYCGCLKENGVANTTACPNPLMDGVYVCMYYHLYVYMCVLVLYVCTIVCMCAYMYD